MGKTKSPYPAAFKQQIVELFQAGRSQSALAHEFDVPAATIANWVARAGADVGKLLPGKDVLTTAEREELARIRREVRRLQAGLLWQRLRLGLPGKVRRRPLRQSTRKQAAFEPLFLFYTILSTIVRSA